MGMGDMGIGPLLRPGDRSDAVRDLQQRLHAAGIPVPADGWYGDETTASVRAFQERRGLRVDGICGPETWGALIESGYQLGDRLLYLCRPMLRGDDVGALQRRLNALGFDAGREDAIFGPDTERALGAFQREAGLATDRVCGPATLAALQRMGSLAEGSVAAVRERETLRSESRRLDGSRVFITTDLGLAALGTAVASGLRQLGAVVALDTSGDDPSFVAAQANRFEAQAFVALRTGTAPGTRCAYFATENFRSEAGYALAQRLTEELRATGPVDAAQGRTYRLLRETRMAAVDCEMIGTDDADATARLAEHLPAVAGAVVQGVRRGIEEPVDLPA